MALGTGDGNPRLMTTRGDVLGIYVYLPAGPKR
jgi:hypothetical protein